MPSPLLPALDADEPLTEAPRPSAAACATSIAQILRSPRLMSAAVFLFCFVLYTRHNDFPYTYHPDEGGKVFQILKHTRNYHHPLLMLTTTEWVVRLTRVAHSPQAVAVAGRSVTAMFAAASVVALALLAWEWQGLAAGWCAGLVLTFASDLFKTAHYFKEDPALLLGLTLSLLAAEGWRRQPSREHLRSLGIACGLALSGKYLGIVAPLAALLLVAGPAECGGMSRRERLKGFGAAFGLTFLAINLPLLCHPLNPFRSIGNELFGVVTSRQGLTRSIPHGIYFSDLAYSIVLPVFIFAGCHLAHMIATARRRSAVEWSATLFPIVYFTLLSFSPKTADRYLLPVTVLLTFLAVLGAAEFASLLSLSLPRLRPLVRVAALFAATGWILHASFPQFAQCYAAYQHDDRVELAAWLTAHAPAGARVAEDHRVNLAPPAAGRESGAPQIAQTVLDHEFAADLGTLEELRAQGVEYVAVCHGAYDRFFSKDLRPLAADRATYERRREFYRQLFAETKLVWERPMGLVGYLQPGLRLYRIVAK
jgi:hypothetical protein